MRNFTTAATATLAALALSSALTTLPALAQLGTPSAQPGGPQTTTPSPSQPGNPGAGASAGAGAPAVGAPGTAGTAGTAGAGSAAPSPGAAAPPQATTPDAAAAAGGTRAEDIGAPKREERAGCGRRWYRSSAAERRDEEPAFDEDVESEERGATDRRFGRDLRRGYEQGQRKRFSEDRWNHEDAYGGRGDDPGGYEGRGDNRGGYEGRDGDRGGFRRFGQAEREDMRGGRGNRMDRGDFDRDQAFGRGRGTGGGFGPMVGPGALARICGPNGDRRLGRMLDRLERLTGPKEAQRAAFDKLVDAAEAARDTVRGACPSDDRPVTLPGRLAGAEKRLTALLEAIRTLRPPLEEFYASLSEEQKARLYMGRTGSSGFRQGGWGERSDEGRGGGWGRRGGSGQRGGWEQGGAWNDDRSGFDPEMDEEPDRWPDDWRGPS